MKGGKQSSTHSNINPLGLWLCISYGRQCLVPLSARDSDRIPLLTLQQRSKAASAAGYCTVQHACTQYSLRLSGAIRDFFLISGYVSPSPNSSSPFSLLLFNLCASQKHKKAHHCLNQPRASSQKYPELVRAFLLYCSAFLPLITGQCFGTYYCYTVSVRHRALI